MTPPQAMHSSSGWAWNDTSVAMDVTLPAASGKPWVGGGTPGTSDKGPPTLERLFDLRIY
jgi:hypothetical protein